MSEYQLMAFEELFCEKYDQVIPLPPELATIYSHLSFPVPAEKPYVICNFVSTIDGIPPSVQIVAVDSNTFLSARDILKEVTRVRACDLILTEGGPQLFGDFLAEKCLYELFLTLAPQITGRDRHIARDGIVTGKIFAPEHPLWAKLISVKRGGSDLFLRYAF